MSTDFPPRLRHQKDPFALFSRAPSTLTDRIICRVKNLSLIKCSDRCYFFYNLFLAKRLTTTNILGFGCSSCIWQLSRPIFYFDFLMTIDLYKQTLFTLSFYKIICDIFPSFRIEFNFFLPRIWKSIINEDKILF